MRLVHGTTSAASTAFKREGVKAGTYCTPDLEWAKIYAARAGRWDGVPDNSTGLIVVFDAARSELRYDEDEDGEKYKWMVLRNPRPVVALRPVQVKLSRRRGRAIPSATSPVLPDWAGFSMPG